MSERSPLFFSFRLLLAMACLTTVASCGGAEDGTASAGAPSSPSAPSTPAAPAPPPAPAAAAPLTPSNLSATPGNAQINLSWSASATATSYSVKRSTTSGGPYTQVANISSTSYTDTSVTNGVAYQYVVTASNEQGSSGNSAPASATAIAPAAPVTPVFGDAGCGLAQAAFCDTFDAISATRGRGGDLNASRWSASRSNGQLPSGNGAALAAGPATIGTCRPDLSAPVFPPRDFSICDPNTSIRSPHLAVATGSQNYGQNSFRIRQPFDFRNRTGKIVFDAEGFFANMLLGWASIAISEDPISVPSFIRGSLNDEGGAIPRSAVEIHFARPACQGGSVGVRFVGVFREHQLEVHESGSDALCVSGVEGHLNHFVIEVSRTHIAVRATQHSEDGVTFGPLVLLYETDVNLPFERGYVQLSTHNHATRKYTPGYGVNRYLDAWVTRWDNVGFDGPVVSGTREYEVADSLIAGSGAWNQPGPVMNVGYRVAGELDGPRDTLTIRNVDLTGMTRARLSVVSWYNITEGDPLESFTLRYRLNNGTWRERKFTAAEMTLVRTDHSQGLFSQMLDLPLQDLVAGTNTLQFTTRGVPQNYPPLVANIDLVLDAP